LEEDMRRRTAVVTGASGGIGLELARLLAADGYDLVLVARGRDRLENVATELRTRHGVAVCSYPRDLSHPGAVQELWREWTAAGIQVDILVNNAGLGLYGPFAEQDPDAVAAMVELNVTALTRLTRLALSGMRERRWGRILNIASVVGYQPGGPGMAAYYASKAYVLSFSKGLARELAGTGVIVTALCPPTTATAFEARSGASASRLYRWLPGLPAEAVARSAYRGMKRGAMVVLPGLMAKLVAFAGELPPRRIALEANRFLLGKARRA
jgi:short-subunit dehydrogenase